MRLHEPKLRGRGNKPKMSRQPRELRGHEALAPSERNINQIHSTTSALEEMPS